MGSEAPARRSTAPAAAPSGEAERNLCGSRLGAGRPAQPLPLAASTVPGRARRRPRAHRHGMVAASETHARLFPGRDDGRPALLALSRRTVPSDRRAALVFAGVVRVSYAELAVTTNFSFLRGASHPREFVVQAQVLGYAAIGIADRNTLAGVVRAYEEWQKQDAADRPRLLVGARLVFQDGTPDILVYPRDRAAYGRLCRLLSLGKYSAHKGGSFLYLSTQKSKSFTPSHIC